MILRKDIYLTLKQKKNYICIIIINVSIWIQSCNIETMILKYKVNKQSNAKLLQIIMEHSILLLYNHLCIQSLHYHICGTTKQFNSTHKKRKNVFIKFLNCPVKLNIFQILNINVFCIHAHVCLKPKVKSTKDAIDYACK